MDSDDAGPDAQPDGGTETVAGTVTFPDGRELPVALSDDIVKAATEESIDLGRLAEAATPEVPDDFNFDLSVTGAMTAQDESATVPVQDHNQQILTSDLDQDFDFIQDPQIQKLQENSVLYTQRVGRYIIAKDDLIPSIKERIKALIVGMTGISVDPSDPDDEADQRLAEHLRGRYEDDVRPTEVIDDILRENFMHARVVLRSTDLDPLDLSTLDYLKDGITGEEIYMQDPTTVYEFDVEEGTESEPGDIDLETRQVDERPLVIGEHVFDIQLYDQPPLQAIVDTVINKMVMQRLKARKSELTSFGAVYAQIEPPSYLPEREYFDRVQDDSSGDEGDSPPTKLERALRQNMDSAFDHLKEWQSGTTMAIPDFWSLEQIEIPENNEPLDNQIRGYNKSIARRLLYPFDLIELREGAELSRETMFRTLMTTIAGWRAEIIRIFDEFAQAQAEIHGLNGDVDHSFPPLKAQDEELVLQALQFAGIAGLSEREVRQMLNQVEGIDLDISDDQPAPNLPSGGPDDASERSQQMRDFLEDLNDNSREPASDQGPGTETAPPLATAATQYSEGDRVRLGNGKRGVVTEVRMSSFEGPSGSEEDASDDSPVYVVATVEGAVTARASDLQADDWSSGVKNPEDDVAGEAEAWHADIMAALPTEIDPRLDGTLEAGPTDFDFPESWRKSDRPARLILLDAWAGMNGQFDCGGDCCKGEMMSSGMTNRAANQFCASMKDRVLMWEGWRKGGG